MTVEFINQVLKHRKRFIDIGISLEELKQIQDSVLFSLGLSNLNELRDKLEGVAFYNKFSKRILSALALQKYLGIEIIDWDNISPKKSFTIAATRSSNSAVRMALHHILTQVEKQAAINLGNCPRYQE